MKTFLRIALIGLMVSTGSAAFAQGMPVALLDVGYIFKNHPQFQQQMDAMKDGVKKFEEQLKARQQQIQQESKQLSAYRPGSPEYKRIEEDTTKKLADLKVQAQLKRKEIMENEAKLYLATYKQVEATVAAFAQQNRIPLVLRYDREANTSTSTDPRETLKIINRPIIYQGGIDITDKILEQFGGVATRPQNTVRQ